jgi:hypothetical protein
MQKDGKKEMPFKTIKPGREESVFLASYATRRAKNDKY